MRTRLKLLAVVLLAVRHVPGQTLVRGALIVDGTGTPATVRDLRVRDGRIQAVGSLTPEPGDKIIDGRGKVLAPGFIDIHNHSETRLESEPQATSQIAQGITTLAVGPDGSSPWPIKDYLDRREQRPSSVNVLSFVGHATIRQLVLA